MPKNIALQLGVVLVAEKDIASLHTFPHDEMGHMKEVDNGSETAAK